MKASPPPDIGLLRRPFLRAPDSHEVLILQHFEASFGVAGIHLFGYNISYFESGAKSVKQYPENYINAAEFSRLRRPILSASAGCLKPVRIASVACFARIVPERFIHGNIYGT
ncbi:MAG: hypothetical protein ABR577_03560 [Pyrinomonadaceae bacterium]